MMINTTTTIAPINRFMGLLDSGSFPLLRALIKG